MQAFLKTLLECSIAMSVISLAYMAAMVLLSKRYTAKWRYYVWLVVVIGWVLPFRPHFDRALLPANMPAIRVIPAEYIGIGEPLAVVAGETVKAPALPLWWIIAAVWVMGVIGTISYHAWRHRRFTKMVRRWSEDVTDGQPLGILNALKAEMGIGKHVDLKTCPGIASPMMMGFLQPVFLLPSAGIADDELALILRHEAVHLKRNDLWYKALVLLATAIHWFNPVVHIMARAIAVQCEISCDELVLEGTSLRQRRQYGEAIIGAVRNGAGPQTALSTNYYGGKKDMKARIFSIMDTTKKKAGVIVLCAMLVAIIGAGMVFAAGSPASPVEVESEKTELKLEKAPNLKEQTDSEMPTRLVSVKLSDESKFSPEEWRDILARIESGEVGLENEAGENTAGPVQSREVINVDVKSLDSDAFVCLGQYTLQKGDIIQYNITAEESGILNVGFSKTADPPDGKQYLGHTGFAGNSVIIANYPVKFKNALSGTYYLWIGYAQFESLNDIKGTVEIFD